MLSRQTIDAVNDIPLEQAIGYYISDLKKSGANYTAKSPFVDEKSASFTVSPGKSIWKCFSSGIGGKSPVSFVEKHLNLTWIEAIKDLAEKAGIPVEIDDSERSKKYLQTAQKKRSIQELNAIALDFFTEKATKIPKVKLRTTKEMYDLYSIGYSEDSFDSLHTHLTNLGVSFADQLESGLIAKSASGKHYDFFRGRIMFPILDKSGKVVGFSGRNIIDDAKTKEGTPVAKVSNSKDTLAYKKGEHLLGFFQAQREIALKDHVFLCEGNFDLTAFASQGILNTVASLGTALTQEQIELLLRHTKNITLVADNDAPGIKAIKKNTRSLLENGLSVMLFIPEGEGVDPDDLLKSKKWKADEFLQFVNSNKMDAVEFLAKELFENATTTISKARAIKDLEELLAIITDASLRNAYVKQFAKEYSIVRGNVESLIKTKVAEQSKNELNDNGGFKLPSYLKEDDLQDWNEFGFYSEKHKDKIGYYFPTQNFGFERVANFILSPLFQVESKSDSKRFIEIKNALKTMTIEVPNKGFGNVTFFDELVGNYGNFWFHGSKKQFQKLRTKILAQFPFCLQIRTLGWQRQGFFSFANGIVENNFKKIDQYGLVHFGEEKFFLPAFSSLYVDSQEEDDEYKNDRFFVYKPGTITLSEWSDKMMRVHQFNGAWATLFFIASLFRDHIFSLLSFYPYLFGFGQPQTGKSTCARSLNSIFFGEQPPFNLSAGTQVAFFRKLERVRNAIVWFDEYTNEIDEKRFQALKAGYDGAGHERGTMSRDSKTDSTAVNSAAFQTGQYLPTRDDNSMFTRSIVLEFKRKAEDLNQEDIDAYNDLKSEERKGLSHLIVEVVRYRDYFVQEFEEARQKIVSELKKDLQGESYKGRILENVSILIATHKVLADKLDLKFTFNQVYNEAKSMIVAQSEQISDSDAMGSFWKMLAFLSFDYKIQENQDYIIREEHTVTVRNGKEEETISFTKPTNVLYIQLTKIHPLYMAEHRKQHGENGVSEQSIRSFIKSSKYFIGNIKSINFEGVKTSAYAFYFDSINVNLKRHQPTSTPAVPNPVPFPTVLEKQEDLPF